MLDRLLLIGDPQMTDAYSYDRPGVLLRISEFFSDLYMDRNYRHLQQQLEPKGTIFMGDLMDGGREWDDIGWKKQATRFRRLFKSNRPQYFMAGNHDLGFGDGIQTHVMERFQGEYGPTSYTLSTGTPYSIVVVDTVSLSATHTDLATKRQAWDVLERHLPPHPRILMTHVPLYRPPGTSCGPDRQSRSREIRQGRGYQYQNLVNPELSRQLLDRVNPVVVFSGDDHDYCLVKHDKDEEIPEISVPTFSMAQGMHYPGVILLDLSITPDSKDTTTAALATKLCWLPDQIAIFIGYGCLCALSIASLMAVHIYRWNVHRSRRAFGTNDVGTNGDDPVILPRPAVFTRATARSSLAKRQVHSFFKDVADVASIGILAYIVCLITL
ncbi:Metallo-dependent phosphatase [Lichtheimia hyalospora FSU 10163]|nr:Metallo-dependent phosphatase [Lichtheimia hyalospora FSU 10163]